MKLHSVTAIMALALSGALFANTANSPDFLFDLVTPKGGDGTILKNTDMIAYSEEWAGGDWAQVTALCTTDTSISRTLHTTSEEDKAGSFAWDYVSDSALIKGVPYKLNHQTKLSDVSIQTLEKTMTILPEPALLVAFLLLGAFLGRRSPRLMLWLVLLTPALALADTVSGVKAAQRWPWNGLVDIEYTLAKDSATTAKTPFFKVEFAAIGKTSGKSYTISHDNLSGQGSSGQVIGAGTKKVTWDASKENDAEEANEMAYVTVTATDITASQKYMKVDLVNGTVATDQLIPDDWDAEEEVTVGETVKKVKIHKTQYLWFKWVDAGTFKMGAPTDEIGYVTNEGLHEVTLSKGFWISVFELTDGQYDLIMGTTVKSYSDMAQLVDYNTLRSHNSSSIDWPMTGYSVSADSLLGKLRAKFPPTVYFDLPTEAQWEYACRAGNGAYKWNDGSLIKSADGVDANLSKLGWYDRTLPAMRRTVGLKLPNDWGLYDMHGNLLEWCLDLYASDITSLTTDPVGPQTTEYEGYRVVRGGAFDQEAKAARSARRLREWADFGATGNTKYGARLVMIP